MRTGSDNEIQILDANGISLINPATKEKQEEQITLETTLNALAVTLQELAQRLAFFGSIKQSQTESLRATVVNTVPVTLSSTTITSGTITNFGTGIPASEMANDINNMAAQFNINNVSVTS